MTTSETIGMREKILEEAARLFVDFGYNGISMREIAEAVGISKAALYYHFTDKQALLLAILLDYLEDMNNWFQVNCAETCTVREQITKLVKTIFDQAPMRRAIIRLASQEMPHLTPEGRIQLGQIYYQKFIGQIEHILQRGIDSGELHPMRVHEATWVLLGMMYPFFSSSESQTMICPQEPVDLILSLFFDGAISRGGKACYD